MLCVVEPRQQGVGVGGFMGDAGGAVGGKGIGGGVARPGARAHGMGTFEHLLLSSID